MSTWWSVALQDASEVDGAFSSINASKPLILQKRKKFQAVLGKFTHSPISNFSPKHLQTHQSTLKNLRFSSFFSSIFKVEFLHPVFLSLVPYLVFELLGYGCSFLATIHTPFTLQLFLASFYLIKCFYYFSQHVLPSQHVIVAFFSMFPRLCHDLSL